MQRKKERMPLRWFTVAALVAVAMLVSACGSSSNSSGGGGGGSGGSGGTKGPIVIADMEGPVADGGPDFTKGMLIAQKQINDAGGVMGRKIQVKIFPKGLTPDEAVQAYRQAAGDSNVVTGWVGGGGGLAIKAQANRIKLPFFAAVGSDAFLTPVNPYAFSLSAGGEYATSSVYWAMKIHGGVKKIAILHYTTDFSNGLTPAIQARCTQTTKEGPALGCQVVDVEQGGITDSAQQLIPQLTKMKDSGADAYYIECLNPNGLKAARQLGMFNKPVICEQWMSVPSIAVAAGSAAAGVVYGGHKCRNVDVIPAGDPVRAWCEKYIAEFKALYPGQDFAVYSIYGDDAVQLLAEAAKQLILQHKPVTRENLRSQYEKFNGSFQSSHGYVKSSPTNHELIGSWTQAYVNYQIEYPGGKPVWHLAPGDSGSGAHP